jgi:molybdopterin/thiamine biosynthesis adenylyltransferase
VTVTLVLPPTLTDEIQSVTRLHHETAGVMLASIACMPSGDLRVLARTIRWVPENAYTQRAEDGMSIRSEGYVGALAEAENIGASCLWIHTHPGTDASPIASEHDRVVDCQLSDLFRMRSGSPYYGALVLSPRHNGVSFSGYIAQASGPRTPIDRLWELGERWRTTRAFDSDLPQLSPIFDRNVRAFGTAVQETVADLRVGIVGCGGTGSAVGEQLVRLGVRKLLLVDPDTLSDSNVTRVYGSTAADIHRPKVDILAQHLSSIAPDLQASRVTSTITVESSARNLISCDVVFGCTDDNAGRLVLSRFSSYFLTPVIDCGVLLSSDATGLLTGIDGRVTVLSPGDACLTCRDRIDLRRAAAEMLTPAERIRLEHEGYAPALGRTEPAVVAYTTLVAAMAVAELLERLVGYGPLPRPSEILLRCHDREISTNVARPRLGHYCDPAGSKLGIGLTNPFLEQTWPH